MLAASTRRDRCGCCTRRYTLLIPRTRTFPQHCHYIYTEDVYTKYVYIALWYELDLTVSRRGFLFISHERNHYNYLKKNWDSSRKSHICPCERVGKKAHVLVRSCSTASPRRSSIDTFANSRISLFFHPAHLTSFHGLVLLHLFFNIACRIHAFGLLLFVATLCRFTLIDLRDQIVRLVGNSRFRAFCFVAAIFTFFFFFF